MENLWHDSNIKNSEKFLNTEAPFTLSINFEEEFFKSIAIEGLVIKGYAIDFTLEIEKSFSSAAIFEDLTQYKDYRQGLSIYDSIAEILDTKQFATDYKIDLMNKDDFYSKEFSEWIEQSRKKISCP